MATRTINAKTDLTYEEIYEGFANGKSRLPTILKDIAAGTGPYATLAAAEGVDIFRRRTAGGTSETASSGGVFNCVLTNAVGVGLASTADAVAKLVTFAHYDSLVTNYDGGDVGDTFNTPPSRKEVDVEVGALIKEPFELLDLVAGVNNSEQTEGSGGFLSTRAAKLLDDGSGQKVRIVTETITDTTQDFDVRERFGDRIGGYGETGAVHGVDQNIPDLIDVRSRSMILGDAVSLPEDMSGDTNMSFEEDGGTTASIVYPSATLSIDDIIATTNAQAAADGAVPVGGIGPMTRHRGNIAVRAEELGVPIEITEQNTVLGLSAVTVAEITLASASLGETGPTGTNLINLSDASVDRLTILKWGTYQFGTLRVFNSINDTTPVAVVLHPDYLSDLIANNA